METKVCSICKEEKTVGEFGKRKASKDGLMNICKLCAVIKTRKYVAANKEMVAGKRKAYYEKNKELISVKTKEYRGRNQEIISDRKKEFYYANRETLLQKSKEWRLTNASAIKIHRKEQRIKNMDKIKEQKKSYRERNRDKLIEIKKLYYKTNRSEILQQQKVKRQVFKLEYQLQRHKNYINHKDSHYERHRLWKKKNPARLAIIQQNHRAKKVGNGGKHTVKEWLEIKAKYNFKCLKCGKSESQIKLTKDHVFPLKWGGSNNITNIQPLCHNCNSSKNRKYIDYRPDSKTYGEGWKKPSLWV